MTSGSAGTSALYGAFISYSRSDREIARRLQQRLERYVLPRAIRALHPDRSFKSRPLQPLFRDEVELVPGRDLPGRIREALARSRSLIVLCSPAAAASAWVDREVQDFLALDETRPIVAVIVAGTPNAEARGADPQLECLPPSLRGMNPDWVDWRTARDRRRANFLRIVAAVLSLRSPDELVRRHVEARRRRWLMLGAGAAALALIWGLSIFFYARNNALKASESLAVEARAAAERGQCAAAARFALAAWRIFAQPGSSRKAAEAIMYRAHSCLRVTWGAQFPGSSAIVSPDGRQGAVALDRGAEVAVTQIGGAAVRRLRSKQGKIGFPLAFSPSGRILVTSGLGATMVWRIHDGTLLARRSESFSERPEGLNFSRDETRLLVGYQGNKGLNALYAFSLSDGSIVEQRRGVVLLTLESPLVAAIPMRPEDSGPEYEAIELWRADDPTPQQVACEGSVLATVFSRDGKIALSTLAMPPDLTKWGPRLCVFDAAGNTVLKKKQRDPVRSLVFNRKGTGLLMDVRTELYFFDLETEENSFLSMGSEKLHIPAGSSDIFSADDTRVALAGDDGLHIYDLRKRRVVEDEVSLPRGTPHVLLPQRNAILISDESVRAARKVSFKSLSLAGFTPYARIAEMSRIKFIDLSQDGRAVAASDYEVETWDLRQRRRTGRFKPPEPFVANDLHVDGERILLLASRFLPYSDIFTPTTIWDVRSGSGLRLATNEELANAIFSRDGGKVLAATRDGNILLFSALSGRLERKLGKTAAHPREIALVCEDRLALIHYSDGSVFSVRTAPIDGDGAPAKVADGVHQWTLLPDKCRGVFVHATYVDGQFTASEGASLWQFLPARKQFDFHLPPVGVTGARFSPSGREVGLNFDDSQVGLWSATDGKRIRILKQPEPGSTARFYGFQFSPNGRVLVGARENDYFWVWDVATGEVLRKVYDAERGGLEHVNFFGSDKMLTTSLMDGSLTLWDMTDDLNLRGQALADALCGRLRRADETKFEAEEISRNVFLQDSSPEVCS